MGIIRILLAVAVFLNHTGPIAGLKLTGGLVAVQTFYIISGFYMALILSEKYRGSGRYRLFVSNRFLKIFPIYWVILVLTTTISVAAYALARDPLFIWPYLTHQAATRGWPLSFLVATNLLIFGQDAVMFLKATEAGTLVFTRNFALATQPLSAYLLVPQAWTLGVELTFYLLAPFLILRSTRFLVIVALLSLLLRLYLYNVLGLTNDPWTYRFFPTELAFFVSGMLSYRLYARVRSKDLKHMPIAAWGAVTTWIVGFQFLPGDLTKWVYYLAVALLLPLVFVATKDRKWDRLVGEMSYPVYLSHMFVIGVTSWIAAKLGTRLPLAVPALVATLALSLVMVRWISQPLETFRQSRGILHHFR